ncbi:MAG: choice-of-anchor J domain-containing protein [Clostridia bacterium]|nr:choice-of-anchor J domain-containing protein [Clostridia bacterium]
MTKKLLGILVAAAMLLSIVPAVLAQSAPERDGAASAIWDFETDPSADGWTFVDEDGDGYNWTWAEDTAAGAPIAASGTHALRSFSYYSQAGALTPDNWAITPEVQLSEDGEAALNYKVASYSGAVAENYRIYVFADGAEEPAAVTEELASPDSNRVFEERTVDLSSFAGQSVKVAFRHYNTTNHFRIFIDDVEIIGGEAQEPIETEPPAQIPMIAGWYFESDPELDGWQFIDANGDGYNWFWNGESSYYAYEGYGSILSASYQGGSALTPDNWAISPAVELPNANLSATFYAKASSSGYANEHFAVYVGMADDISEMSEALPETVTTGSYVQYTVDLSDYANETVYIAIRHFNCYDQMRLVVDQFEVWGSEGEEPVEPTVPPTEAPAEPTEAPVEPTEAPVDPTEAPAADEPIFGSYFEAENDPVEEGWQFVDSDGDGRNWQWKPNTFGVAYEGSGIIASYSYVYPPGNVNPDNWAISPAIELPAENLSVTFYAKGYLADYCSEHFAVYAGTSSDLSDLTEVLAETVTTGSYVQYTADLSDFANETVYIAIRHFNTNPGEEAICVDQFEVWGSEGETPVGPEIIGDVNGDGEVTAADALLALRYVMALEELGEEQLAQADVDGDGEVTMMDCLLIQRYAMGIIASFPA